MRDNLKYIESPIIKSIGEAFFIMKIIKTGGVILLLK